MLSVVKVQRKIQTIIYTIIQLTFDSYILSFDFVNDGQLSTCRLESKASRKERYYKNYTQYAYVKVLIEQCHFGHHQVRQNNVQDQIFIVCV